MTDSDTGTPHDGTSAARAWADIIGVRELTIEERQRFGDWLRGADHEGEFLIALEIRLGLAQMPESEREALRREAAGPIAPPRYLPKSAPSYLPKKPWSMPRLAAAAAVVLLGVVAVWRVLFAPPHYSTGTGERTATFLADGSRAELSSETDLEWLGGTCDRRVRLNRGEALFEVHSDPHCPFRVFLGRDAIEVLGTQFDVYRHRDGGEQVSVLEGRVRIHGVAAGGGQPWQLDVGAGQEAIWSNGGPASVRPFNSDATTAWREDRLEFYREPLARVVEQLQRYITIPIRIADPRLLTVLVNANLRVDERHIRASVLWLGELPAVQVHDDGHAFTLTYRAQAPSTGGQSQ